MLACLHACMLALSANAACCCCCCAVLSRVVCRYVVVEADGVTAASWQRGANNVLALQLTDEEVEVYDNW